MNPEMISEATDPEGHGIENSKIPSFDHLDAGNRIPGKRAEKASPLRIRFTEPEKIRTSCNQRCQVIGCGLGKCFPGSYEQPHIGIDAPPLLEAAGQNDCKFPFFHIEIKRLNI